MSSLSASILACRHTQIGSQVSRAVKAGASFIHIDIMDGVYVQNMTFGPQLIAELRQETDTPISIHFETFDPERMYSLFENSGADIFTFQMDACSNPIHLIQRIKKSGKKVCVGIGPAYPVSSVQYVIQHLDYLTVMSVEPGYGGQRFEESVYGKLREVRALIDSKGLKMQVAVDGGVNAHNIPLLKQAGADIMTCGTSLVREDRIEENAAVLLQACSKKE